VRWTADRWAAQKLKLWQRWHDGQNWQVREAEKLADKDGIAVFDLPQRPNNFELFATASQDRQAFSAGNSYGYGRADEPWRIYAFTDRPPIARRKPFSGNCLPAGTIMVRLFRRLLTRSSGSKSTIRAARR